MDKNTLKDQFAQLLEQVDGFDSREKTEREKQEQFRAHRDEMLAQIPEMGEVLADPNYTFFGAVAFLGKFQFVDIEAVELCSLIDGVDKEKLLLIVEKKNMLVAENAKPAWDFLFEKRPVTLCAIVALCFMAEKSHKVQKLLKKTKTTTKKTP